MFPPAFFGRPPNTLLASRSHRFFHGFDRLLGNLLAGTANILTGMSHVLAKMFAAARYPAVLDISAHTFTGFADLFPGLFRLAGGRRLAFLGILLRQTERRRHRKRQNQHSDVSDILNIATHKILIIPERFSFA